MPAKVAIEKCADYEQVKVDAAVRSAVDALGGIGAFVKPGQRVLLKPNLLSGKPVEKGVCTHPAVFRATVALVREAGGDPFMGDSPGFGSARRVAQKCGLLEAADELGVEVVNFTEAVEVDNPWSKVYPKLHIARQVVEADAVINLCRVKSHGMMLMTMAVKNLFGCVVGLQKAKWHLDAAHNHRAFTEMLLSVYKLANPVLSIADAIVAMEGNGPGAGTPRPLGFIAVSPDAVALDSVIGDIVGLKPQWNLTATLGGEMGFGEPDLSKIDVSGPALAELRVDDFQFPRQGPPVEKRLPKIFDWLLGDAGVSRPEIDNGLCTRCSACIKTCPADAMALEEAGSEKFVRIDRKKCIHCFCCQEVCPENAISPRPGWLARILK